MAEYRTRQTAATLHTAGPNIPNIRLNLLGPAAFGSNGSGPSRSKESDADLSGVERVEGDDYGEPNRDGPGLRPVGPGLRLTMYRSGNVALFMAMSYVIVGILHRFATPLYKGEAVPLYKGGVACERCSSGVRFDGSPISSHNEYTCCTNMPP
jgi:hypothetical protein